jgi:Anti-sigma-K factor rskA
LSCDDVRLELAGVATGDIPPAKRTALEAHIDQCNACRSELRDLRETIDAAGALPLEQEAPEDLERDVFRFIELDRVARAVSAAPLEREPPMGLERNALDRSGAWGAPARSRRWQRLAPVVAPGLAASLLILGFLGVSWYSDAADARRQLNRVDQRFGAWGDAVKSFELTPAAQSTASWPSVPAQLMRLPRDHFALVLHLRDYPPTPDGYVCQLWLVSDDGERTPLGAFAAADPIETRTFPLEVPVDPRDFPRIEVTLEPVHDDEAMHGPKIMEATLDF